MGARPAGPQWAPLGLDSDPVPGDPDRIRTEQTHLANVAKQISHQVDMLRQISRSCDEVGAHADKIREKAGELAGDLDKVVGRYQKVSSALHGWIPELESAQKMSLDALNQAEGPHKQLSTPAALPSGDHLTAQQKQAVKDYHNSMNKAQDELNAAKRLLDRATGLRDHQGSYYAGLIKKACDDGMKDSWWDKFKDFVGHWSWLIKDICTVLEVVATIAAIVAFIIAQFIPGLDVLVDALVLGAFIATAVAASGRLLLAATGNGSWMDFAIDIVTLATFGAGRAIGAIAKGVEAGVEAGSKVALSAELSDAVMQESPRGMMLLKYAQMQGVSALDMADRLGEFAPSLAKGADSLDGAMKVMNSLGSFGEEGGTYAKLLSLSGRFGLDDSGALVKTLLTSSGGAAGFGGALGIATPTVAGLELDGPGDTPIVDAHIPGVQSWYEEHVADPTTGAISTGAANVAVDTATVAAPAIGIPMDIYRYTHGGGW